LLERGQSVKRQRNLSRRVAVAKKFALAAAVILLIAVLPFATGVKRGKAENPEARRLYELGRWHLNQLTDESMAKAIEYLNQAIQVDPQFVRPYVSLFELYCWNVGGITDKEKAPKIRRIALKLMALDPKLAEAHAALAAARYNENDWRRAEEEMRQAIKLNPNYAKARSIYGFSLAMQGRIAEAQRELQQAQKLDPTSRIETTVAGFPFIVARDY